MTKPAIVVARNLQQNPIATANEAADYIVYQELEITKFRYALKQIADGNDPLTVMRSIARQALNKK